jgi:cyanate permease
MTNSFGILIMFRGMATAVGPPLAGKIYDSFKSYVMSFVFTGFTIAVSGAMCFLIPYLPGYKPQSVNKK